MSSRMTSFTSNKTTKINWADDDEDDFDFEAWKATADTSAPTMESLPPLQLPTSQVELSFTSTFSTTAPWVTSEPLQADQKFTPQTTDWRCGKPMLAWRATQKSPALPAYIEMSTWDNGVICAWNRVQYAQHWGNWKAWAGADCRRTALFRTSSLREVELCEEDVETQSDLASDVCCTISTDVDVDVPKTLCVSDEGYCTDDSPLLSPTFCAGGEVRDVSTCATQIGISPATVFIRHYRVDSQEALEKVTKAHEDEIDDGVECEGNQEVLWEDDRCADGILKDVSTYLSGTAAKGWQHVLDQPWTTVAVLASGMALGASMYLMRKR